VVAGALISLVVVLLSPLASANPDGLNRVAIDLGFIHTAQTRVGPLAVIPSIPWIDFGCEGCFRHDWLAVVGVIIALLGQGLRAKS